MNKLAKTYRKDIDGLRFIAVFAVVINHLNNDLLPMGYLGVDIFFVISGYVISMSILNSQIFSLRSFLISFFNKRIKRILPGLMFYILVIGFLTALVIPMPGSSLKTGMFSMVGVSNIFLYNQSIDYFASASNLNTFTNTWSLSVEEQFYIIYPFLIWLFVFRKGLRKTENSFLILMSLLSSISFFIFLFTYKYNINFAYYLLPARFWEIGLGCISYLSLNKFKKFSSNLISFISFVLIIFCIFYQINNPVLSTFIVVISTCFLIIFNKDLSIIDNILSNNLFIYFGRRSYSIYLWHWGVISLFKWSFGISKTTIPIIFILFMIFSLISFEFIENPLRKMKWFSNEFLNLVLGLFMSFISCISLFSLRMIVRYADKVPVLYKNSLVSRKSVAAVIGCMGDELPEKCLKRKSNKPNAFLLGDSHLVSLVPSIGEAFKDLNYEYSFWGGVEHIRSIFNSKCNGEDCYEDISELKEILKSNGIKRNDVIVYTLSRNRVYSDQSKSSKYNSRLDFFDGFSRKQFVNRSRLNVLEKAVDELVKFAEKNNAKFILVDSIPITCDKETWIKSVSKFSKTNCEVNSIISKDDREPLSKMYQRILNRNNNVFYIDPHDQLCVKELCSTNLNNKPLYSDNSPHLGWESRLVLKDFFKYQLKNIIKNN